MKKILNPQTMVYEYPDGSGAETFEHRIEVELFRDKWKMRGEERTRNYREEYAEFQNLFPPNQ